MDAKMHEQIVAEMQAKPRSTSSEGFRRKASEFHQSSGGEEADAARARVAELLARHGITG